MNVVSLSNIERLLQSMLHEASHYLDNLKTMRGIEPPDYMQQPTGSGVAGLRSYYRDVQTEYRARVTEVFAQLANYDQDYVRNNQDALKMFYVNQMMGRSGVSAAPLVFDAEAGSETIRVENRGVPLRQGLQYDIAEQGAIEEYILNGDSNHEIISVQNIDEATDGRGYILTLSKPLSRNYSSGNGASIYFPPVEDHPFFGTKQELFGLIVKEAVKHYLNGGTLADIPSKPTVEMD